MLGYRILIAKESIQNCKFWLVTQQITKSFHAVSISVTGFFVLQFSGVISETCDSLENLAHWPETTWNKNEIFSNHVMLGLKITRTFFSSELSKWHNVSRVWEKQVSGKERKGKESEVVSGRRKSSWGWRGWRYKEAFILAHSLVLKPLLYLECSLLWRVQPLPAQIWLAWFPIFNVILLESGVDFKSHGGQETCWPESCWEN